MLLFPKVGRELTAPDMEDRDLDAVVTGIFTISGVVVTATAALVAAWIKYKTDRRQELRRERRELYARFHHVGAQLWDALGNIRPTRDNGAEPSPEALKAANEAWVAWAKVYGEMSIAASDDVWRMTDPMFYEMRSAYFQRRLPSGPADQEHEDALREQMRHELGR